MAEDKKTNEGKAIKKNTPKKATTTKKANVSRKSSTSSKIATGGKNESKKVTKAEINKEKIENVADENIAILDLKTVIILIAIIAILIMILGYFYFNKIDTVKNIQTNGQELITEKIQDNPTTVSNLPEFSIDRAKSLIRGYLNVKAAAQASPKSLLQQYGLVTEIDFAGFEKTKDEKFFKTSILYENVKNKFLEYIMQDFFLKEFKDIYQSSNGLTYVAVVEQEKESYIVTRCEQIKTGGKPVVKVWYKTKTEDGKESEEKSMEVEFTARRGNWFISNIK